MKFDIAEAKNRIAQYKKELQREPVLVEGKYQPDIPSVLHKLSSIEGMMSKAVKS